MENISNNLFLRDSEMDIVIIWVGAIMDDAIHIKIEVVKFWDLY